MNVLQSDRRARWGQDPEPVAVAGAGGGSVVAALDHAWISLAAGWFAAGAALALGTAVAPMLRRSRA
ncbi:hypothetical protein NLM33_21045 [Bradyrhizobium sp. CCGUVB1N3]|uniref:hypothetical protein n=1 Tax=Bradyrhizobium sp. CCGUVB1N3 TaxID=2949629 RepID=UPI0020B23E72|nr:hypothetical protein [Bradyrhizobium sp. CCGUVB1N3]MCP3472803.1 hypothetical protein [Bradyrhizobium sp. CCGUVB1N3]